MFQRAGEERSDRVALFVAHALDLLGDVRPGQLGVIDQLTGSGAA
jgi:hypothetical protein